MHPSPHSLENWWNFYVEERVKSILPFPCQQRAPWYLIRARPPHPRSVATLSCPPWLKLKAAAELCGSPKLPKVEGPGLATEGTVFSPLPSKRDVAAANFSLHEAHCQRFLAICPECEEPVALKDMKAHHGEAHQQVRCRLCHQAMQQYLLQHHEAEECPERPVQCRFCDLELPFQRLQPHLEACGSRTTSCWDCGKYVMYRTLEEHNATFHASQGPRATGGASPSLSAEPKDNICELCKGRFSDEQYLRHLNECAPLPQLLGLLSPGSPTEQDSRAEEKAVRPKSQGRGSPSLLGKPSLKPPKGRRAHGRLAFTPLAPQVLEEPGHAEDPAYDQLAACNQCNILLPSPTLEKHERKCRQRKAASGQTLRRSPRLSGRGESTGQRSPSKEAHGQL